MARSKDIRQRYQQLNDILNQTVGRGTVFKTEILAQKLDVSKRQIWHYLNHFKDELQAPLAFDQRQKGWFYEKPFLFIDGFALSRDELQQLKIALEMLSQESGLTRRFGQFPRISEKIREASRKVDFLKKPSKVVFFDPLPDYEGARLLPFFLEAIEKDWKVEFEYKPYGKESKPVEFEPYFLRQWEGRWYVGGQSHDPSELDFIRVYPLERIVGEPVQHDFALLKPANFSAETYWATIYGINQPKDDKTVREVILRFAAPQHLYFLGAPFFPVFRVLENDETGATISMNLILNIELLRKLASFGKEVRILAPESMKQSLTEFHRAAL